MGHNGNHFKEKQNYIGLWQKVVQQLYVFPEWFILLHYDLIKKILCPKAFITLNSGSNQILSLSTKNITSLSSRWASQKYFTFKRFGAVSASPQPGYCDNPVCCRCAQVDPLSFLGGPGWGQGLWEVPRLVTSHLEELPCCPVCGTHGIQRCPCCAGWRGGWETPSSSVIMCSFPWSTSPRVAHDFDVKVQLKYLNYPSQSPEANFFQKEDLPFVVSVGTSLAF